MRGREHHLTQQVGEHLVAAELGRRDLHATTFAGNVPHYDILAMDPAGRPLAVQVKAVKDGNWQLDASKFVAIRMLEDGRQDMGELREAPCPSLVFVFVRVGKHKDNDAFYVLAWDELREVVKAAYGSALDRWKDRRPKNPKTCHVAIKPSMLPAYRNNWDTFPTSAK